ncbi:MAG: hypothetical protein PHQ43_01050 [Dehalococcoidales bacterium]|nr:hypothetical protein [Dehalococcoidales bacterium]
MLYSIDLPYAHYGVEVRRGKVVDAPPIARWMVGKPWVVCAEWVAKKHGTVAQVSNGE